MTTAWVAHTLSELVLNDVAANQLQRVVEEHRQLARLEQLGLAPRRRLLLVGPAGTGKTMSAAALAGELGLPLFMVRLDSLVSQSTGHAAARLRQLFDLVAATRGVYCFDKFEAIASLGPVGQDAGEIRQLLNSLLLMFEHDHSNSLIVAATHRPELLDQTVFRYFDDVIEYHCRLSTRRAT